LGYSAMLDCCGVLAPVNMIYCFYSSRANGTSVWLAIKLAVLVISIPEPVTEFHYGYAVGAGYAFIRLVIGHPIDLMELVGGPIIILYDLVLKLLLIF